MGRALEEFLQGSNRASVRENGDELFDLSEAKYSVTGEYNRCLLHLWSAERSLVRRIVDMEIKTDVLRLAVQKLGQSKLQGWKFAALATCALPTTSAPHALPTAIS